jgi:hypothetical protein
MMCEIEFQGYRFLTLRDGSEVSTALLEQPSKSFYPLQRPFAPPSGG